MMRPAPLYIHLFVLLFAGFLISGALTPSISDESIGNSDGLKSSSPSPSPSPSTALDLIAARSSSRKLLDSDGNKYDRLLLARSDGTIYFVDRQSMVPLWKFVTGSPILYSKQADPDVEYFIDFGANGQLYEYSKAFGRRELNTTLEELVHGPVVTDSSSVTFGSKETTLHFLNETNGEVLSRHHFPATQTKSEVPLVEEKLVASEIAAADGYIMLVRTDYSLKSIALPSNPTQITLGADKPLWQLSRSDIRAMYIKKGQSFSSNMGDKLALSSSSQIQVPVHILPMASKMRGAIDKDLMLPSASYPAYAQHGTREMLMLLMNPVVAKSVSEDFHSPVRNDKMQELLDDGHSSSGSSSAISDTAKNLLEYSADKRSIGEVFCEPGSLQSQSGDKCRDDNTSSIPLNINKDANSQIMKYDHTQTKTSNEMLAGLAYGILLLVAVTLSFIILVLLLLKLKRAVRHDVQMNDLKGKQSISPKKRKARRAGGVKNNVIVSNSNNVISCLESDTNGHTHAEKYWSQLFNRKVTAESPLDGRWVGKLFVSNSEIGRGSNGTVVLEGVYDGRRVAVKRLLCAHHDVALKEIQNLIVSDRHPNIVRLYGVEQDLDFVYISLELCSCSLSDLIQSCADSSMHPTDCGDQTIVSKKEHCGKSTNKDLELWRENGFPSSQLLQVMRDVVAGLAHLHELGIIHRDMKPQNVLISTDGLLNAKVSDMGISKRLLEDMSSLTHHATGCGSSGWQAPEQLLCGRQTRAVDLFSLGCILFFCITKGRHPFGTHLERDSNIVNNRIDLFLVDHMPEAWDLLSRLLNHDPNLRPSAAEVLHHPFFWSSEMRLTFLRDTSDRVELKDREGGSQLLKALENVASEAFGGKWGDKLDVAFITDMGRYRKYKFECTRDLLRVIRNKLNHYRELPEKLQAILGPVPEGFDSYFSSRFPKLLIEVYKVVHRYCREEDSFSKYFPSNLI